MSRRVQKVLLSTGVFIGLAVLPVIPVLRAAVVPNPVYRLAWISLVGVFSSLFRLGISYQFSWFTFVVLVLLIGSGWGLSRWLIQKIWGHQ